MRHQLKPLQAAMLDMINAFEHCPLPRDRHSQRIARSLATLGYIAINRDTPSWIATTRK